MRAVTEQHFTIATSLTGLTKNYHSPLPLIFYDDRSTVRSAFPKSYSVRADVNSRRTNGRRKRLRPREPAWNVVTWNSFRQPSNYACFSAPTSEWYSLNDLSVYFQRGRAEVRDRERERERNGKERNKEKTKLSACRNRIIGVGANEIRWEVNDFERAPDNVSGKWTFAEKARWICKFITAQN